MAYARARDYPAGTRALLSSSTTACEVVIIDNEDTSRKVWAAYKPRDVAHLIESICSDGRTVASFGGGTHVHGIVYPWEDGYDM